MTLHPLFARTGLLLTLGFAIVNGGTAVHAAKPVWLKLQTKEFVVYSDAKEKDVIESALRYAAYRRAFDDFFVPSGGYLSPSILLMFRAEKTFHAHLPTRKPKNTNLVNFSTEVDGVPLTAFPLSGDPSRALEMTSEFETIWALKRLGYYVPVWMSQGTGGLLSAIEVRPTQVTVGRLDQRSVRSLTWPRFFEVGEGSKLYHDSPQLGDYLAQARELMHWILLQDESTRERFTELALQLRTSSAIDAVQGVMKTDMAGFNRAITEHLRRTPKRVMVFDPALVRASFQITVAPEAEVLVTTAELLAAAKRFSEANANLDRAHELAPELSVVKDARARRMLREGRTDEAVRLYREAIDAGSKNPAAYLRSAQARLDDARTRGRDIAGEGGSAATIAVEELRRAISLNRGNAEAYQLLGRAFYVMPELANDHVEELSRGVFMGEQSQLIRLYRSGLYSRLHQTEKAVADLRHVIAASDISPQNRSYAQERLAALMFERDLKIVESHLKEKNHGAAREVLTTAASLPDCQAAAPDYARLSTWVDESEAWSQLEALGKTKSWAEFRAASRRFAERFPHSQRAREARRIAVAPPYPGE